MFLKTGVACCLVAAAALGVGERARVDRATSFAAERLTEWLGPANSAATVHAMRFAPAIWSSPRSMDLESQAVFQLSRSRFAAIAESPATAPFLDGVAWHLQSRIVEELFDLAHLRPGHHAIGLPLFGDHVTWTVPSLVVARSARDERISPAAARTADAVDTLENVVGWPALAAALRVLAAAPGPIDRAGVQASLEASLGVPVGWFLAALEPDFRVDYSLVAVASEPAACGTEACVRTSIDLARNGAALFPDEARAGRLQIAVRLDFGERDATFWWSGRNSERLTVESAVAPVSVLLDPERMITLDSNRQDQVWRAAPGPAQRPIKALAAWMVWLQHAVLTYAVLL